MELIYEIVGKMQKQATLQLEEKVKSKFLEITGEELTVDNIYRMKVEISGQDNPIRHNYYTRRDKYYIDDKWVMTVHPIETDIVYEDGSYKMKINRKIEE